MADLAPASVTGADVTDGTALVHAVRTLLSSVAGASSPGPVLRALLRAAVAVAGSARAVAVSYDGTLAHLVEATDPLLLTLEQLQEVLQIGPAHDCLVEGRTVRSDDLRVDARWAALAVPAVAAGAGAVVALPLRSRERSWGALVLYADADAPWRAGDLDAVGLLTDVAASYLVLGAERSDRRRTQTESAFRSLHDPLTGLAGPELLSDRIGRALARGGRRDTDVAVALLDLEPSVAGGHPLGARVGDEVLVTIGNRLVGALRPGDTVARLAGDRFAIVCEDLPRAAQRSGLGLVESMAERIRLAVGQPIDVAHHEVRLSARIGVLVVKGESTGAVTVDMTPAAVLRRAEHTLEQARRARRDQLAQYGSGTVPGTRELG